MDRVPVYEPWLREDDVQAVARAVRGGWIAKGPQLESFERRFAELCGAREGVAVANGTVALELALRALDVGPGDEVICPSFTIISCALAIVRVGARPIFVDVDPGHWGLDPDATRAASTARTKAILGVHAFGHPFDPSIVTLARERGIALVEDAAEAHGAALLVGEEWRGCGSVGAIGTFSLYANKAITSGEGGVCVTSDPSAAHRLRSLRDLCFVPERRFLHHELGANARLSNIAGALVLSQLDRFEEIVAAKRALGQRYRERLEHVPAIRWQAIAPWARAVPWMIACVLDDAVPFDGEHLARRLDEQGIETRPLFLGMHEQPALAAHAPRRALPVTERLARRGLYLPSSPQLRDATLDRVCDAVTTALSVRSTRRTAPTEPDPPTFGMRYAALYDAFYADKPYAQETRALLAAAARHAAAPRRAVDFGCGTGGHLLELARAGLEVIGVEPSGPMLARARERLHDAGFEVELIGSRASQTKLPPDHDLASMLFAVLSYHDDDDELRGALTSVRASLRHGGLFIADPWYGPAVLADPPARRTREVQRDGEMWTRVATPEHDPLRQLVRVHYSIGRTGEPPIAQEIHSMRYFFPRELDAVLRATGFELLELGPLADGTPLPGTKREYAVTMIARAC